MIRLCGCADEAAPATGWGPGGHRFDFRPTSILQTHGRESVLVTHPVIHADRARYLHRCFGFARSPVTLCIPIPQIWRAC